MAGCPRPRQTVIFFAYASLQSCGAVPRPANIFEQIIKGDSNVSAGRYGDKVLRFEHEQRLVDIRMDDVVMWLRDKPDEVELLSKRGSSHLKGKGWQAVQNFYEAFEKGSSSVINGLHHFDAASRRFADSFIEGARYPVDVYMYLTPPNSQSYGYHNDVMDAWMIQLHGWKKWSVCDRFAGRSSYSADLCWNVTLKGGDVMYVPFLTNHYVWTESELSAHLTVNVERHHYVWGSVIVSALRHRACPTMSVDDAASRVTFEGFKGEGRDSAVEQAVIQLLPKLPELSMAFQTPEVGADWLPRSAHNEDHPDPQSLFEALAAEYLRLLSAARSLGGARKVSFDGPGCQKVELFSDPADAAAIEELHFVVDAMRLQVARTFKASAVEAFSSLAMRRTNKDNAYTRGFARAMVGEDKKGPFALVASDTLRFKPEFTPVAKIALAAVAKRSSFTAEELAAELSVPQKDVQTFLKKLLYRGALQTVPAEVSQRTEL
eukprot:TRINITY_DN20802_c0_g1_i3.p1 TRINITY_DN20802_c0_g1~~TRINITY_DN20802_c0_g1_i3.p1  ORF type:complete len:490 (-),score=116.73 TRINITY_DN20802_c0_g1_i3:535-2004(-)